VSELLAHAKLSYRVVCIVIIVIREAEKKQFPSDC